MRTRQNIIFPMALASVMLLLAAICVQVYAQEQRIQQAIVAKLVAGESGYEMPITVSNQNSESIDTVKVDITALPAGFTNVSIEPPQIDELVPGETTVFLLTFDVDVEAQAQPYAEIVLAIQGNNAEFNEPQPVVAVAIAESHGEAEIKFQRVLRLVEIQWQEPSAVAEHAGVITHALNEPGFTVRYRNESEASSESYGLGFTDFPLEIIAGEAFSVSFEAHHAKSAQKWCYHAGQSFNEEYVWVSFKAGLSQAEGRSSGVPSFANHQKEMNCSSKDVIFPLNYQSVIQVKADFAPVIETAERHMFSNQHYTYSFSVADGIGIDTDRYKALIYWRDDNLSFARNPSDSLRSDPFVLTLEGMRDRGGIIRLRYQYVPEGEFFLTNVPRYERPGGLQHKDSLIAGQSEITSAISVAPAAVGLNIRSASKLLESAGFTPVFELGPQAPSPLQINTVARQHPAAGVELQPGSEVTMSVYTEQTESVTVPNVTGMSIVSAKAVLQHEGLSIAPELGKNAVKASDAGVVYKQSPPFGTEVSERTEIRFWVYGEPQDQAVAGTVETANAGAGKPNWDHGCNMANNTGGATLQWLLRDPPPYSGRTPICSDRDGKYWILGNQIPEIELGEVDHHGCYPKASVKASNRNYRGTLCHPHGYVANSPGRSKLPGDPDNEKMRTADDATRKFAELVEKRRQQREQQGDAGQGTSSSSGTSVPDAGIFGTHRGGYSLPCSCKDESGRPYRPHIGSFCGDVEFERNYECYKVGQ